MKYKLKDINLDNIRYELVKTNYGIDNNCKIVNFTYNQEEFEFQTPRVLIEKIIKENEKSYLLLKIVPTEASKLFCLKLFDIEEHHSKKLNKIINNTLVPMNNIKSIFNGDCFIVKIPMKYSKPQLNIYSHNGSLFNYYDLREGMEIICLLSINKLWINFDNSISYYLNVKEILLTNKH